MDHNDIAIIIGSDHAAYPLKERVKKYLIEKGFKVEDVGTNSLESVNYTEFGKKVALAVSKGEFEKGILLCGTGLGMSMVANKYSRVRAALCGDIFSAKMSRLHNNSNILVMGGRVIGEELAFAILDTWLETPFEGGRHQVRIDQFDNMGC